MNWWEHLQKAGQAIPALKAVLLWIKDLAPDTADQIDLALGELDGAATPESAERLKSLLPAQVANIFLGQFDPRQPPSGFA